MVLPERQQATQQIRATQERAVIRSPRTQSNVIAATCSGVTTVEHEFFRAQTRLPRFFVQCHGIVDQFLPMRSGVNIHLNNAGVRCNFERFQTRVRRRLVTFQQNRHVQFASGFFQNRHQFQIMFQIAHRRQEHMQTPFACLDTQSGTRHIAPFFDSLLHVSKLQARFWRGN